MTRRWMAALAALALTMTAAACARPGVTPDPGAGVTLPPGTQLVAASKYEGGFVPLGWSLIQAPTLAVYSDGLAVSDARQALTLTPTELRNLVGSLRRDLSGFGLTVDVGAQNHIADAPNTILQVLDADGTLRTVSAYALGIERGYPVRLVSANNTMADLARRVTDEGTPYQSSRVRLVAELREAGAEPVPDWPTAVPVPPKSNNAFGARVVDLEGDVAAAVVRQWPQNVSPGGVWPVYRIPDGTMLGVAWRYLLPHE